MAHPWTADVEIDLALARLLIAEQVRPFGEGWDNAAFLVDGPIDARTWDRAR